MNHNILYHWMEDLAKYIPSLNTWSVQVLALMSYGVVLAKSSKQVAIATHIIEAEKVESAVKRLQRFLGNPRWLDKRFFHHWAAAILEKVDKSDICLLVDETNIKDRFRIMMLGIDFRGRSLPLIWRCWRESSKKDFPKEGKVAMICAMLDVVLPFFPAETPPVLMVDRGLGSSPNLVNEVEKRGIRFMFRVNKQVKMIRDQGPELIYDQVKPGTYWKGRAKVFSERGRVDCYIRAFWKKKAKEPVILITNDPSLSGYEYKRRFWQENCFRDLKSGGLNWEQSMILCPDRMQRFIGILVVAYVWMINFGCYAVNEGKYDRLSRTQAGDMARRYSDFNAGLFYFWEIIRRGRANLPFNFIIEKSRDPTLYKQPFQAMPDWDDDEYDAYALFLIGSLWQDNTAELTKVVMDWIRFKFYKQLTRQWEARAR